MNCEARNLHIRIHIHTNLSFYQISNAKLRQTGKFYNTRLLKIEQTCKAKTSTEVFVMNQLGSFCQKLRRLNAIER